MTNVKNTFFPRRTVSPVCRTAAVFLIGMVEGILPSKKGDIEEERRICFVAISRAMKLLYLSWSHTYLGQPSKRSLFLDEIMEVKGKE